MVDGMVMVVDEDFCVFPVPSFNWGPILFLLG